jgi:oligopeptide/dipeptide ABC transporter ATP-binding protein
VDAERALLDVAGLSVAMGDALVLDDVSFAISPGETLGLVGESGCGKSVTALSIMRLLPDPPARVVGGRIAFGGVDLLGLGDAALRAIRGDRIAMIFQEPMTSLNPVFTIGDQIGESLIVHRGASRAAARAEATRLLDLVGIPAAASRIDRYPHELSGGQRQRAVIARALVLEPDLLVCDEPISALDVSIQAQIVNLLQTLQRRLGITFVFISHDLKIVHYISDEIAVMYLGRIVERGPRDRVFDRPVHPYTKALVAAVPVADPSRPRSRVLVHGDPPSPFELPQGCRFHTRCPLAVAKCREIEPGLADLGSGHHAACHLAVPTATAEKAA